MCPKSQKQKETQQNIASERDKNTMERWVENIRVKLEEKAQRLCQLLDDTVLMVASLKADDLCRVTASLEKRGRSINRINQIDNDIELLAAKGGYTFNTLPAEVVNVLTPCLKGIENVSRKLSGANADCLDMAQRKHDSQKEELLAIRRGLGVAKGYRAVGNRAPKFLDTTN